MNPEKTLSRRDFLRLSVVTAVGAALAGCNGKKSPLATPDHKATAQAGGKAAAERDQLEVLVTKAAVEAEARGQEVEKQIGVLSTAVAVFLIKPAETPTETSKPTKTPEPTATWTVTPTRTAAPMPTATEMARLAWFCRNTYYSDGKWGQPLYGEAESLTRTNLGRFSRERWGDKEVWFVNRVLRPFGIPEDKVEAIMASAGWVGQRIEVGETTIWDADLDPEGKNREKTQAAYWTAFHKAEDTPAALLEQANAVAEEVFSYDEVQRQDFSRGILGNLMTITNSDEKGKAEFRTTMWYRDCGSNPPGPESMEIHYKKGVSYGEGVRERSNENILVSIWRLRPVKLPDGREGLELAVVLVDASSDPEIIKSGCLNRLVEAEGLGELVVRRTREKPRRTPTKDRCGEPGEGEKPTPGGIPDGVPTTPVPDATDDPRANTPVAKKTPEPPDY